MGASVTLVSVTLPTTTDHVGIQLRVLEQAISEKVPGVARLGVLSLRLVQDGTVISAGPVRYQVIDFRTVDLALGGGWIITPEATNRR